MLIRFVGALWRCSIKSWILLEFFNIKKTLFCAVMMGCVVDNATPLHKIWSFPLWILVKFTEEIINAKLHFCTVRYWGTSYCIREIISWIFYRSQATKRKRLSRDHVTPELIFLGQYELCLGAALPCSWKIKF